MFEVILRNSIDRHLTAQQGNEWLENAVGPGGYFDISPGCEDTHHSVQEAIHRLGLLYTHNGLITRLTFGFWTYLFAAKQFAAAGSTLLAIFPNRPFGTKQKTVFQNLIKINELRNRIAHYEPICFEKGTISTNQTERRYHLLVELLGWLGCDPQQILLGIDGVGRTLSEIHRI